MSPSADTARPERNRLLAALPAAEYALIARHLTDVSIAHRQAITERGQPITAVYFPRGAVISLLVTMDDGAAVEGATIGHEGMIGLAAFLDDGISIDDAVCQVPGPATCLDVQEFRSIAERSPVFQHVLRRYTLALMGQMTRTAGCNRVHPVEERLARWLLMTQDRVGAAEFSLTHDYIAAMLGVRRPSVTVVAGVLQKAGLIEYRRGRIRVLDRERLQEAACEDYRVTEEIYERLFRKPD
jgi:CRP-like cAMP-binding protein